MRRALVRYPLCLVVASVTALAATSNVAFASPRRLTVTPLVVQHAALFLSDHVTAGGIGGGIGVQLSYENYYVAQLDINALWMLGNALSTRLAIGAQWDATWSPAAWLTTTALFGDRLEFLTTDGQRPAVPSCAVGVRVSPLRFRNEIGVISTLEPSIATDLNGGLWLDLTLLQAGTTF